MEMPETRFDATMVPKHSASQRVCDTLDVDRPRNHAQPDVMGLASGGDM